MTKCVILGHRGASAVEPENTMRAFHKAVEDGADGIELDIHKTKDEKIVVIHDATIDRTSNGFGKVAEMTYADLQKFDFGNGEKIPLLEDVLKKFSR
ncbi:MAG: glycerophosphodiester phosphodiesterase family protein, partial [Asgard group archaeon]|nr:glycerophosphodiester phosphodiesterase family protein [Asgard group archaeon]